MHTRPVYDSSYARIDAQKKNLTKKQQNNNQLMINV
jgi:hypothetical protein